VTRLVLSYNTEIRTYSYFKHEHICSIHS